MNRRAALRKWHRCRLLDHSNCKQIHYEQVRYLYRSNLNYLQNCSGDNDIIIKLLHGRM